MNLKMSKYIVFLYQYPWTKIADNMKQTDIFRNVDKIIFHIVQDLDEIFFVLQRKVDDSFFSPLNISQNKIIASQFHKIVSLFLSVTQFLAQIYFRHLWN